jgi:hypothetical protein
MSNMTRRGLSPVEAVELRYEHLGPRRHTPARMWRRHELKTHIDRVWAEQEQRDQVRRQHKAIGTLSLQVAERYAGGRIRP